MLYVQRGFAGNARKKIEGAACAGKYLGFKCALGIESSGPSPRLSNPTSRLNSARKTQIAAEAIPVTEPRDTYAIL